MVYDFHTHTFLSDGTLSPAELVQRAHINGYNALAITDHVGLGNLQFIVETLVRECTQLTKVRDFLIIPGVEITHVPRDLIGEVAAEAKALGARIVIVHGETIVEPVEPGTNLAALTSPHVDILAHPGLLSEQEATLAAANGIFIELSAKRGHSLTNGHVARCAQKALAPLILDSDAHEPEDLLTTDSAWKVALGSGLTQDGAELTLQKNPLALLRRLGIHPSQL